MEASREVGSGLATDGGRGARGEFALRCFCQEVYLVSYQRGGWTCPSFGCRSKRREIPAALLRLASIAARAQQGGDGIVDLRSQAAVSGFVASPPPPSPPSSPPSIAPVLPPLPPLAPLATQAPTVASADGKSPSGAEHSAPQASNGADASAGTACVAGSEAKTKAGMVGRKRKATPPAKPTALDRDAASHTSSKATASGGSGRGGVRKKQRTRASSVAPTAVYTQSAERTRALLCSGCPTKWYTYPDSSIYDSKRPAAIRASMKAHKNKSQNCRSACKSRHKRHPPPKPHTLASASSALRTALPSSLPPEASRDQATSAGSPGVGIAAVVKRKRSLSPSVASAPPPFLGPFETASSTLVSGAHSTVPRPIGAPDAMAWPVSVPVKAFARCDGTEASSSEAMGGAGSSVPAPLDAKNPSPVSVFRADGAEGSPPEARLGPDISYAESPVPISAPAEAMNRRDGIESRNGPGPANMVSEYDPEVSLRRKMECGIAEATRRIDAFAADRFPSEIEAFLVSDRPASPAPPHESHKAQLHDNVPLAAAAHPRPHQSPPHKVQLHDNVTLAVAPPRPHQFALHESQLYGDVHLAAANARRQEAERIAAASDVRAQSAESRAASAESKCQQAEARATDAEGKLEQAEACAADAEAKLEQAEARVADVEAKRRQSELRAADTESKLQLSEARVADAESKREHADSCAADAESKRVTADALVVDLTTRRQEAERRALQADDRWKAAETDIAAMASAHKKTEERASVYLVRGLQVEARCRATELRCADLSNQSGGSAIVDLEARLREAQAQVIATQTQFDARWKEAQSEIAASACARKRAENHSANCHLRSLHAEARCQSAEIRCAALSKQLAAPSQPDLETRSRLIAADLSKQQCAPSQPGLETRLDDAETRLREAENRRKLAEAALQECQSRLAVANNQRQEADDRWSTSEAALKAESEAAREALSALQLENHKLMGDVARTLPKPSSVAPHALLPFQAMETSTLSGAVARLISECARAQGEVQRLTQREANHETRLLQVKRDAGLRLEVLHAELGVAHQAKKSVELERKAAHDRLAPLQSLVEKLRRSMGPMCVEPECKARGGEPARFCWGSCGCLVYCRACAKKIDPAKSSTTTTAMPLSGCPLCQSPPDKRYPLYQVIFPADRFSK